MSPGGLDYGSYIEGIQQLANEFDLITNKKKFLVINTHGWVKGKLFKGPSFVESFLRSRRGHHETVVLHFETVECLEYDIDQCS